MNKRLVKLVASFGLELPFIVHKVNVYDRKMDQIPYEERFNWIKRLLTRARKKANVNLLITGLENLPEKQGYLITPNHQGMFDMVCLFDALDQPFKIIFKKELQDVKVLNKVLHFLEYPAIDRSNLRASVKVIRQVTKELKEGTNYVIFPEGTRSKQSNQTKEFKGGSYKAAIDAKATIVPAAFINSYEVLDGKTMKKIHVGLHFFPPIPYEEYCDMTSVELAEKVRDEIQTYIDASPIRL